MHRPGTRITPGLRRAVRPRRETGTAPLSPLLDRPTARWHLAFAERLRGPLDLGALRTALQTVAARQDALRFRVGDPTGSTAPATAAPLRIDDLTALPRWQRGTALHTRLAAFVADPFDPARRLWRIALYRLDTDEHVLAFAGHRAVFDPNAQARLYADLATAYARARAGRPAQLPPLRIVFADYLAWHGWQVSRRGRADLEWWRGELDGAATRLALPHDPAPPAGQLPPAGFATTALTGSTALSLRALSRSLGAPSSAVVLAAVGIVLGRLSGQADLLVGTPLAARRPAGFEPLVGSLCDIAPIRLRPERAASFAAQVRQARSAVRGARAHLAAGMAQIAAAVRAPATGGLVQVLFEMAEIPSLALAGLSAEPVPVAAPAPVELALRCVAHPGEVRLEAGYDTRRYRPERVSAMLDTLRHVLTQAVTSPDRAVGEFALRPADQVTADHDRAVLDPLGRRAAVGELGEIAARWAGGWVGTGKHGRYTPDGTVEPADDYAAVKVRALETGRR